MGKNYSKNNTGKRVDSDFYETHYSLTSQFLDVEIFSGDILEPAAGNGAIVRVLERYGYFVESYDKETDFLKETKKYENIVTNPPYKIAQEFILKAKEVSEHKIAMLLPLTYLHGKKRLDEIYSDKLFPLESVYVFCRYPMLGVEIREDGKYPTGMQVYAWFVWNKYYCGDPKIKWIDNDKYVLRKQDF